VNSPAWAASCPAQRIKNELPKCCARCQSARLTVVHGVTASIRASVVTCNSRDPELGVGHHRRAGFLHTIRATIIPGVASPLAHCELRDHVVLRFSLDNLSLMADDRHRLSMLRPRCHPGHERAATKRGSTHARRPCRRQCRLLARHDRLGESSLAVFISLKPLAERGGALRAGRGQPMRQKIDDIPGCGSTSVPCRT
jgi:hypothetical protein